MGKPAIIVTSSHVARGYVGCRSAVFSLEILGFPVWAVPTIQLPWHPGHGPSTRMVPPTGAFENYIADLTNSLWVDEVGAVLTGYMASPQQVGAVAGMITSLRSKKPDLVHLCDPVIGDNDGLYVAEDVAAAIRDQLLPICNIATPNLFEAAWLAGKETPNGIDEMAKLAKGLPPEQVIITSCPDDAEGNIGNVCSDGKCRFSVFHPKLANPPNGPGDLTAALFLGHTMSGMGIEQALEQTTRSVFEILAHSVGAHSNELTLAANSGSIIEPSARVVLTRLDGDNS